MTDYIRNGRDALKLHNKKINCVIEGVNIENVLLIVTGQQIFIFHNCEEIGEFSEDNIHHKYKYANHIYDGNEYDEGADFDISKYKIKLVEENLTITKKISETLKERTGVYGSFTDNSNITQKLYEVLKEAPNYEKLTKQHKEAFHMIFHKIARCVCGNIMYIDNIHDIVGYAKLLEEILIEKGNEHETS